MNLLKLGSWESKRVQDLWGYNPGSALQPNVVDLIKTFDGNGIIRCL